MNAQQRRQLILLSLTLLMVMVGFGIILPIMPFYAQSMGASATHLGLLFAGFSLMQFIFSPLWGRYSDRMGRRPVLLLGLTGMALSFVLFGLAQALWMLYAARILGGVLSSSVLPAAMAYVADSTEPEQRGQGMGVMGAAMGLGLIFGPAIGGFLGAFHPAMPFFVAAGLTLLVAGFAAFFLPESLKRPTRESLPEESERDRTPSAYGALWQALRAPVGLILILGFISNFALASLFGTFALFAAAKFGYGEREMGTIFVALGLISALSQGVLVGRMIRRWAEGRVIHVGLMASGIGFLGMIFAFDLSSLIGMTLIIGWGSSLLGPAISSLASQRTSSDQQGTIMGVLNSYGSLGRIVGPLLGGVVFDLLGSSAPFVMSGALFLLTWLGFSMLRGRPDPSASTKAGE
jgi:DHA1 family multidrug resistance protein-like MFS transporter